MQILTPKTLKYIKYYPYDMHKVKVVKNSSSRIKPCSQLFKINLQFRRVVSGSPIHIEEG